MEGLLLTLLPILRMNVEKDRMLLLINKSVKLLIHTTKKLDLQFCILRSLDVECLDKSRCIILQCITETISHTCCAQVITSTIDCTQWTRHDNLQPHSAQHVLTMATSFCAKGEGHNRDKYKYRTGFRCVEKEGYNHNR
jgi:hypothetical protein